MRGFKTAIMSAAFGATALCALGGTAMAAPVTEAGETIGLALGAPLPEGAYFVNTASYIERESHPNTEIMVNIPVLAYSTPWKVLGGRIEGYVAAPEEAVGIHNQAGGSTWNRGWYNPAALVGAAWDLGNGWGFSNFVGGYAPVSGQVGTNTWVFNERAAISYTANAWDLTAHAIYGLPGSDQKTHKAVTADYLNIDLTGTKTFGKWEAGAVGYGTWDLSSPTTGYHQASQIAVGPLVGYNFTGVSVQSYLTKDVANQNTPNDTRAFLRFVVPLGAI